jgi:hypothetical protein
MFTSDTVPKIYWQIPKDVADELLHLKKLMELNCAGASIPGVTETNTLANGCFKFTSEKSSQI